jgi:GNAT superfamily N-acetyltransferase
VLRCLQNGKPVLIRPIRADDKQLLQEGLQHLSRESVERRFLAFKKRFTSAELRYLTEVDGWDHVALVVELPLDPVRRLVAVARYVRSEDDPESAEIAVVVLDEYQGMGLGTLLGEELARRARMRGVRRFTGTMANDNVPAGRLFTRLTDHLERHYVGNGTSELEGDLVAAAA